MNSSTLVQEAVDLLVAGFAQGAPAKSSQAGQLLSQLLQGRSEDTELQDALLTLRRDPSETHAQATLKVQLNRQLEQDPAFANDIRAALDAAK